MRDWPNEAGAFLRKHYERRAIVIAINPLQTALGTGFQGTEGLAEAFLKTLELGASTRTPYCFSKSLQFSSAVILIHLESKNDKKWVRVVRWRAWTPNQGRDSHLGVERQRGSFEAILDPGFVCSGHFSYARRNASKR